MSISTDKKRILEIIDAYLAGTANLEEQVFIDEFYEFMADEHVKDLSEEKYENISIRIYFKTKSKILNHCHKEEMSKLYYKYLWPIAVTIVFFIIAFAGLSKKRNQIEINNQTKYINKQTQNQYEFIVSNNPINIPDVADGSLQNQWENIGKQAIKNDRYTIINVPVGSKFKLSLPDGTMVYLEPSSALKFPSYFTGKDRIVELSGEAYFEVKPYKKRYFKVFTEKQEITVSESNFSIKGCIDGDETQTTCMKGIVKARVLFSNNHITLEPGQHAILKDFYGFKIF